MERFAEVMGLKFNKHKTGSVYLTSDGRKRNADVEKALPKGEVAMNFLRLDEASGIWTVNPDHVQEHVTQLQKQLNESKSVLSWIKTWNSCIGRFFSYTFGEPAYCFGKGHINAVLDTHKQMQQQLFPGSTATNHIRDMLTSHFEGIESPPDAFICMPENLGGLGLRNPVVPLLLLRQGMRESIDRSETTETFMTVFLQCEREILLQRQENLRGPFGARAQEKIHGGFPNRRI